MVGFVRVLSRVPTARDIAEVASTAAQACIGTLGAAAVLAGAYVAKSAAGINLMPGKSPLHELLFHFVR